MVRIFINTVVSCVNMTSMVLSGTPVSVGIHNIEVTVLAEFTGVIRDASNKMKRPLDTDHWNVSSKSTSITVAFALASVATSCETMTS